MNGERPHTQKQCGASEITWVKYKYARSQLAKHSKTLQVGMTPIDFKIFIELPHWALRRQLISIVLNARYLLYPYTVTVSSTTSRVNERRPWTRVRDNSRLRPYSAMWNVFLIWIITEKPTRHGTRIWPLRTSHSMDWSSSGGEYTFLKKSEALMWYCLEL